MKPFFRYENRKHARPAQKQIFCLFLSVCFATLLFFSLSQTAYTCGLIWPHVHSKCHFDGVDNQGNVVLIQKLGELELLKGRRLPFYAVFKSESGNRSPYAGYGWNVPLLESKIVQVDENRFRVFQPDGFQRRFRRDKKNANILRSRTGWTAKIVGDTITAWCQCSSNGSKMVFNKGRLISIEVNEEKFDYVYEGDRVAAIREGNQTIFKVEKYPPTRCITGLTLLNGQMIGLERVKRPLVQVINHQALTNVTVESLSKIIMTNGTIKTFEYGLDQKLNPTLKLNDREIVWDAATWKIIRDGECTYGIMSGVKPWENAAIARTNAHNQTEFWYKNDTKGEEIAEGVDGIKKIKTRFTSGKLRGKIRKEVEIKDGAKKILGEYSYNEKGFLIRIRQDKKDTFLVYEDDGKLAALVTNGEIVRNYTTNGVFLAEKYIK